MNMTGRSVRRTSRSIAVESWPMLIFDEVSTGWDITSAGKSHSWLMPPILGPSPFGDKTPALGYRKPAVSVGVGERGPNDASSIKFEGEAWRLGRSLEGQERGGGEDHGNAPKELEVQQTG